MNTLPKRSQDQLLRFRFEYFLSQTEFVSSENFNNSNQITPKWFPCNLICIIGIIELSYDET